MPQKRRNTRFTPEENTVAWLSIDPSSFQKDMIALVDSESHSGCGITLNKDLSLEVGFRCMVKVGELSPMKAEVRWVKNFDNSLYRLGLHYLE